MNALSTSEEMCLDYIRRHVKAEDFAESLRGMDISFVMREVAA